MNMILFDNKFEKYSFRGLKYDQSLHIASSYLVLPDTSRFVLINESSTYSYLNTPRDDETTCYIHLPGRIQTEVEEVEVHYLR